MKKIVIYLLTLTCFGVLNAAAECNFLLKIGDKKNTKFVEKFTEPMPMFKGQFMLPVPSPEVCPNDRLSMDIAVEYIFLGEQDKMNLAAIRMVVLNDGKNTENNKLTLMNYAKKVYGDFDTGFNPQAYNNFEVWDEGQKMVVYKRTTNEQELIEEELYISNKEYDQKLGSFYNQMEMDMYKEDTN